MATSSRPSLVLIFILLVLYASSLEHSVFAQSVDVGDAAKDLEDAVKDKVGQVVKDTLAKGADVVDTVKDAFGSTGSAAVDAAGNFVEKVKDTVVQGAGNVAHGAGDVVQGAAEKAKDVVNGVAPAGKKVFEAAKAAAVRAAESAIEKGMESKEAAKEALAEAKTAAQDAAKKASIATENVNETVSNAVEATRDFINETIGKAKDAATDVGSVVQAAKDAAVKAAKAALEAGKNATEAAKDAENAAQTAAKGAADGAGINTEKVVNDAVQQANKAAQEVIQPESVVQEEKATCFPASAKVTLANGATKTMTELTIGDHVVVGHGLTSKVFMFTHESPKSRYAFIRLETAAGPIVTLTGSHHIYINGALSPASSAMEGDILELHDGSTSRISRVGTVLSDGLYNPHTLHGDIVVDGIRTSTYTEAVHPSLAHALLAPLRAAFGHTHTSRSVVADGVISLVRKVASH